MLFLPLRFIYSYFKPLEFLSRYSLLVTALLCLVTLLLQDHFMPELSAIVQQCKFNTCSQQPGETIAMFLAELRHLTEHWEFGITIDEMLRDRLVCGVRDTRIQRRLLAEPKLTETFSITCFMGNCKPQTANRKMSRDHGLAVTFAVCSSK